MRTLLILLALLLAGWWWVRRRAARQAGSSHDDPARIGATATTEFHAVAIRIQPYACDAAHKLEGKRFLASDAPRLPLPACNRDRCDCRFQHYADRRSRRDRRSPFGSGGTASGSGNIEQERRRSEGRRADDNG
jgi:hypothetical protein